MSSEDFDNQGDESSGSPGEGDDGPNAVDALLDALIHDAEPSSSQAAPTAESAAGDTGGSDTTDLEEGIVSSLLDELMSAVPGSNDPDFTEGATAIPFANDTTEEATGYIGQAAEPLDAEDPTLALAALSGNEDPTAAVNAITDPDPTTAIDATGLGASEDPTAAIDATNLGASEDPTAAIDTTNLDATEDPTAAIDPTDADEPTPEVPTSTEVNSEAINELADSSDSDETEVLVSSDATKVMPTPAGVDDVEPTIVDTSITADRPAEREPVPHRPAVDDRSPGGGRAGKILALCAVGLLVVVGVGWIVDSLSSRGQVLRGTTLAGESIQGLTESDLQDLLDERTAALADQPMDVAIGDVTVTSDPVTLGVALDDEAIIDEALAAGRGGFILFRPFSWIGRFFSGTDIEEQYAYDPALTTEAAETILLAPLAQVKEPGLTYEGDAIGVDPGAIGTVIDPDELIRLLPPAMQAGPPYTVGLAPIDEAPSLTDEQVKAVADEINAATAEPVALRVLDDVAVVETDQLRAWSKLVNEGDGEATWLLDGELAQNELQPLFPSLGSEDQQARFVIVDEEPTILPASETVICCAEDSADRIREGLNDDPLNLSEEELEELDNNDPTAGLRIVGLEPITVGADEGVTELESLGIIEEVSTFTTNHACCQNRVTNIQRFADLTQGVVIRPGETFSLNGHVGQRTREKGFVADGAINLGVLEPQVGGGISQYATTFFNASFFAGLEFVEYQSHSLYISRYPRGREATISWRRPDLKVKNTTPYGILVWNSYTPTSITVSFYSTKHLEVEALPLRRASERQCRVDITPRLITFEDGTEVEDSVYAVYRPGEGLDCNGDSTRPDLEPDSTPTTVADSDEGRAAVTTTVPDDDAGIDDAITTTTPEDAGGDT